MERKYYGRRVSVLENIHVFVYIVRDGHFNLGGGGENGFCVIFFPWSIFSKLFFPLFPNILFKTYPRAFFFRLVRLCTLKKKKKNYSLQLLLPSPPHPSPTKSNVSTKGEKMQLNLDDMYFIIHKKPAVMQICVLTIKTNIFSIRIGNRTFTSSIWS